MFHELLLCFLVVLALGALLWSSAHGIASPVVETITNLLTGFAGGLLAIITGRTLVRKSDQPPEGGKQ